MKWNFCISLERKTVVYSTQEIPLSSLVHGNLVIQFNVISYIFHCMEDRILKLLTLVGHLLLG